MLSKIVKTMLTWFMVTLLMVGVATAKELVMVNLVYRHGARAPIKFYPNYSHKQDWHVDLGWLTKIGMNMEYDLGKFLKKRYIEDTRFLNQSYHHKEVYIRSSDSPRCLQSAQVQLAGLYPPQGYQIWNKEIPWQPIPIHTVPADQDPMLRSEDTHCPLLHQLKHEATITPEYLRLQEENKAFLEKLSGYAGEKIAFNNFGRVHDTLKCTIAEGLKEPGWYASNKDRINKLGDWLFLRQYIGVPDQLAILYGGVLLNEINNNMNNYMEKKDPKKAYIFSAHDTTLLSLASVLKLNNMAVPTFASCIMVELYKEKNEFWVEINYRNDTTGYTYPLNSQGCPLNCPYQKFMSLTKARMSDKQDCGLAKDDSPLNKGIVRIVVGCAASAILLSIIIACMCRRKAAKRPYDEADRELLAKDEEA